MWSHSYSGTIFAYLSRLCCPEQSPKTTLEPKNHEKTLTVSEVLFHRESVPLSMYGCMESMAIKHHSFWTRPSHPSHFCGANTHIGWFEEPKARDCGHRGPTGAAVDLRATLAGSSDYRLSKMRPCSVRPLPALDPGAPGDAPRTFDFAFFYWLVYFQQIKKKAKAEGKTCHAKTMLSLEKPIKLPWKTPHMCRLGKSPRSKYEGRS